MVAFDHSSYFSCISELMVVIDETVLELEVCYDVLDKFLSKWFIVDIFIVFKLL
jgi:hypothetical protein